MLKTIFRLSIVLLILFSGCDANDNQPAQAGPENNEMKAPKNSSTDTEAKTNAQASPEFANFLAMFPEKQLPLALPGMDLDGYLGDHPDDRLTDALLNQFLIKTPAFPALEPSPRYAAFGRVALTGGNWMLLTYRFSYGHALYATTFSGTGEVLDGMEIVNLPEVPEAISQEANVKTTSDIALIIKTPTGFDEEGMPTAFDHRTQSVTIRPDGTFAQN